MLCSVPFPIFGKFPQKIPLCQRGIQIHRIVNKEASPVPCTMDIEPPSPSTAIHMDLPENRPTINFWSHVSVRPKLTRLWRNTTHNLNRTTKRSKCQQGIRARDPFKAEATAPVKCLSILVRPQLHVYRLPLSK